MYPQVLIVGLLAALQLHSAEPFPPVSLKAAGYDQPATANPVARLVARLDSGAARLDYSPDFGYLPALLDALEVPVSSQALVFSKTSFQATRISPRLPRAIYHNQDVYVGWVRGGDVLELVAADPDRGVVFYSLDQEEVKRPRIERRGEECLQCHLGSATLNVPGVIVRSVVTNRTGLALFPGPSYITTTRSPLDQRWGGWYVSGTHGKARHMGNVFVESGEDAAKLDTARGANRTSLDADFNTGAYLSPHSDLISLLVLEHQTHVTNLLVRALYEHRTGNIQQSTINEVAAGLALEGQATWDEPVKGTSAFTREYATAGRELDLTTRLYRAKRSPMLNSGFYRGLPEDLRTRIESTLARPKRRAGD